MDALFSLYIETPVFENIGSNPSWRQVCAYLSTVAFLKESTVIACFSCFVFFLDLQETLRADCHISIFQLQKNSTVAEESVQLLSTSAALHNYHCLGNRKLATSSSVLLVLNSL
jgi:hypothetical protein